MAFRIALVGESEYMRTRLADLLRNNGFEVELRTQTVVSSAPADRKVHDYDLIITSTDMSSGIEENKVFESMLEPCGFLVLDEHGKKPGREQSFLIHPEMSPEEILATVNSLIFLNNSDRKSPRARVNFPVEYECDGRYTRSTIKELGENGLFISALMPPAVNTKIAVRFLLPGRTREIRAKGRVVYRIGCDFDRSIIFHPSSPDMEIAALPGLGIMIDEISEEDRADVRQYIQQHF